MKPLRIAAIALGGLAAWEGLWWLRRRALRASTYREAMRRAVELDRPLVVVGAPDGGVTGGYPCGDATIDVAPTACPVPIRADITRRTPFDDDSVVVVVMCVLEYVANYEAALAELRRIAGNEVFVVRVEPWTLTAYLYPGARRTLPASITRPRV